MGEVVKPLIWEDNILKLIDQRYLPMKEEYVEVANLKQCHEAIKTMVVRGAPLIGFSALYGMALWFKDNEQEKLSALKEAGDFLITARPTAVNLAYEVGRAVELGEKVFHETGSFVGCFEQVSTFAGKQLEKLHIDNISMAKIANEELNRTFGREKLNLMTLCNTGTLACGPMGTALGVISYRNAQGLLHKAYASETRPYLQGTRLTSYEMLKEGVNHDIVVEGSFSYLLSQNLVDAIFVGADRIVANGDTANKIGTSTLSIVAKFYNVPFYVVAPTSSFDLATETGNDINIELRPQEEILEVHGNRIAAKGATALNPSFDVTWSEFITGIICEKGLISPVSKETVKKVLGV